MLALAGNDLNPLTDLSARVEADPNLSIVERVNGQPQVGTFRTDYRASARQSSMPDAESNDTVLTGVDDDFVGSSGFPFSLTTAEYVTDAGIDHQAVWDALRDEPGRAVVNALLVPSRAGFDFQMPGVEDADEQIEAAFFEHGLQTLDLQEAIADFQAQQRSFFNLVLAFMTLGLVVGIAALGVISARAVVERRHEIEVMRAIGYSRGMVQLNFLAESSFITILGIAVGLGLGLLTSVNVAADIQNDEPTFALAIPWVKVVIICVGAYVFSLLTTYLPSRQAAAIAPAQALRYE